MHSIFKQQNMKQCSILQCYMMPQQFNLFEDTVKQILKATEKIYRRNCAFILFMVLELFTSKL